MSARFRRWFTIALSAIVVTWMPGCGQADDLPATREQACAALGNVARASRAEAAEAKEKLASDLLDNTAVRSIGLTRCDDSWVIMVGVSADLPADERFGEYEGVSVAWRLRGEIRIDDVQPS